jgi:hypothetical protein
MVDEQTKEEYEQRIPDQTFASNELRIE